MRKRLSLALLVSIILIGGATFVRAQRSSGTVGGSLVAVNNPSGGQTTPVDDYLAANNIVPQAGSSTESLKLNETDLIGRQLVSDYLDLSANGQVTDDSINSLAATYSDNIANLKTAPQITLTDIKTSIDTQEGYQTYADAFLGIYAKYTSLMSDKFSGNADVSKPGAGLTAFSTGLSDAYAKEAAELEALAVPPTLASSHLKLVNNYLTAAWAMKAVASAQTNPAEAMAGIVAMNDNAGAEKAALGEIVSALRAHGIIIDNQ